MVTKGDEVGGQPEGFENKSDIGDGELDFGIVGRCRCEFHVLATLAVDPVGDVRDRPLVDRTGHVRRTLQHQVVILHPIQRAQGDKEGGIGGSDQRLPEGVEGPRRPNGLDHHLLLRAERHLYSRRDIDIDAEESLAEPHGIGERVDQVNPDLLAVDLGVV